LALTKFFAIARPMSLNAVQAVWDRSARRGTERLLLLTIADFVNEGKGGVAWPGVSKLAQRTRLSERQVQRKIRALERSGELQVSRGAGPKGTNLYRICLSAEDPDRGDDIVTRANSSKEAVSSAPSKGDASVTQSVNEPLLKCTPIVPIGDEKEFWINICFECFGQASRPLRPYFIAKLESFFHALEKKKAPALIKFYRLEPIDSKEAVQFPKAFARAPPIAFAGTIRVGLPDLSATARTRVYDPRDSGVFGKKIW
jgi:hypothetical protein